MLLVMIAYSAMGFSQSVCLACFTHVYASWLIPLFCVVMRSAVPALEYTDLSYTSYSPYMLQCDPRGTIFHLSVFLFMDGMIQIYLPLEVFIEHHDHLKRITGLVHFPQQQACICEINRALVFSAKVTQAYSTFFHFPNSICMFGRMCYFPGIVLDRDIFRLAISGLNSKRK